MKLVQVNTKTFRELIAISLPMVVSQGAFAVMMFTDRYFMSLISPIHLSASLGGGVASFFCLSLFFGVLSYTNALVAQDFGAAKPARCTRALSQSLILALACIPLLLLITYAVSHLFTLLGHEPQQSALEIVYFKVLMLGAPITLFKVSLASYFSGIGRTRKVMIADTLGVLLNVPLSFALIFGKLGLPEMGIVGAGIGTIVSSFMSLLTLAYFYFQRKHRVAFCVNRSFVFDRALLRRHLRFGFPSGLELFLNVGAFNLFLLMFQSYGIAQGAAAAIVLNWDVFSFVPLMGLNIGIVSLIGRSIGASDMEKAREVIASGFILGLGYSLVLAVIFIVFREPLVDVFIDPGTHYREIKDLSMFMMLGLSSYVMADAVILVAGGVLRGAGDTRWLMWTSVALHWLMLVAQFFVIKTWAFDPRISWLVFVAMIISIACIYLWRLNGDRWRSEEALRQVTA